MEQIRVHFVETIEEVQEFFTWLSQSREWLAIDVETDGLRWWDGILRLVQFGDEMDGWAIPWEWYPKVIMDALKMYEGRIVGANFNFDTHWLERFTNWQRDPSRTFDSQVMIQLFEPHLRAGLKEAAKRHIHPNAADGERKLKAVMVNNKWEWGTIPIDHPAYWGYACVDTILTARIAAKIHPILMSTRREVYEMETAVQQILYRMERKGAMIDRDYTQATSDRFQHRVDQLLSWGHTNCGINLGSNQQVITYLINKGVEFSKTTPSGALALDDEVLIRIIRDFPGEIEQFATAVRSQRKLRKLISTYLNKFLELSDSNGHLHASIRQLGAKTGRMSVATPSLQNLPRNEEVRSCFVPSSGNRMVLSDFDQIEIRLLAHFCQDPRLIAAILDPSIDVHTGAARLIYNDPMLAKGDPRRMTTKNAVFAKVYGAGAAKFALTARIPEAEAIRFMHDYDNTFPEVNQFIGRLQAVARQRMRDEGEGYVMTPMGRKETVGSAEGIYYKLVNYLIQGTAADVMKNQMVALDAAGLGEYMTMVVHDEIIMDVPVADVEDVGQVIQREMPIPAGPYTVPITSDLTVVDNWGEKYQESTSWMDEAFADIFAEELAEV